MPTINGTVAVFWGTAGLTFTGTGVPTGPLVQSADFNKEADFDETRNSSGDTVVYTAYNKRNTLTLEVVPSAATQALAADASIMPDAGAIVTVADTSDDEIDSTNAGKYICTGSQKRRTNAGKCIIVMNLLQFVDNDVAVVKT